MYSDEDLVAKEDINKTIIFTIPQTVKQVKSLQKPLHHIPIKIDYNGPAAVSSYFHPHPRDKFESSLSHNKITHENVKILQTKESQYYSASFRGREVTGKLITLPSDTVGLVIEAGAQEDSGIQVRKIGVKKVDKPAESSIEPKIAANCTVTGAFNQFYIWNKDNDEIPSNYMSRSIDEFLPLANALHSD